MLLEYPTEDVLREHVVFELGIPWWTFVKSDAYAEWLEAHALLALSSAASPDAMLELNRSRARERAFGGSSWDETKHPRHPAGSEAGGEFMPKWGEADLAKLDAQSAADDADRAAVHDKLANEGTAGLDWRSARAEFDDWSAEMEQWYLEKDGHAPDYWPNEREELWRRYQDAVVGEGVPLKARLDQSGVEGVTVEPQLSSANGGDMDVILDPDRELSPDFNVEMPGDGPEGLRPGFSVWTYPDDIPDVIEDIIPLDDTDYFPGGPESPTAQNYTRLLDAAAGRPSVVDPTPVTMYRGMSDREINAWADGEEIPAGKFFTSTPTTAYAQDINAEPPVLQQFRVPRDMLIEVAPGEFQLRKRARMKEGRIEAVTAAAWEETKHPRHPAGSESGGEFMPKGGVVWQTLTPKPEFIGDAPPEDRKAFVEKMKEQTKPVSMMADDPAAAQAQLEAMLKNAQTPERRAEIEALWQANQELQERQAQIDAGTYQRHSEETVEPDALIDDQTDDYVNEIQGDLEYELDDGDPNGLAPSMREELERAVEFQGNVSDAINSIGQVHDLPASADTVQLQLRGLGPSRWGEHYGEMYVTGDPSVPPVMKSRYIALNPSKEPQDAGATMAHEFGHYVDVQVGDGTDWFSNSEAAAPWRDAVMRSDSVKILKAYREHDPQYVDYLLDHQEIWARSYAQWVALRSGNTELAQHVFRQGEEAGLPERQWGETDFGPIATQIDKIMAPWMKPHGSTASSYTSLVAAPWEETKHPRHPAGSELGGEFAPGHGALPAGYELRNRRRLAASTKKSWRHSWGLTLRDLWIGGGHGWQPWGSGHSSSGITNALVDRGLLDVAEKKGKTLLYRITPDGLGRLEDWWTKHYGKDAEVPDPPEGWPDTYEAKMTPSELAQFRARRVERQTRELVQRAHRVAHAPRIAELQDELHAFEQAKESRARLLADPEEAPFVDMQLADWQEKRAAEIHRELRGLLGG